MSKSLRVDLHAHTTRSDGSTPPRALVRLACDAGIDVLAVTDHDSVEAVPECLDEARDRPVRILPGIEVSSRFEGRDVHVLGYGIDHASESLLRRLSAIQERRRERVRGICARLAEEGVALEPDAVMALAGGKSVGRRHVAMAMLGKGIVSTLREAFARWLGPGAPANLPANEMTPREAAELIGNHGGVAVLAHPGFLDDDPLVERVLDAAPIRGIEVFHRYGSPEKHLRYLDVARRRDLLVTGGSDFHGGEDAKNPALGSTVCPHVFWKHLEKRLSTG